MLLDWIFCRSHLVVFTEFSRIQGAYDSGSRSLAAPSVFKISVFNWSYRLFLSSFSESFSLWDRFVKLPNVHAMLIDDLFRRVALDTRMNTNCKHCSRDQ